MFRGKRAAALVGLCACLLGASAAVPAGAAVSNPTDLYWLGPYFAGMRLTSTPEKYNYATFSYGDCELPEGEGGCSVPAQIQNWSSCARNPLRISFPPYQVFPLRGGGIVSVYESSRAEVATGDRNVVVFARPELVGAALLRLQLQSQPGPEALAPPEYPLPVLRELKRVTGPAARGLDVAAIAKKTEVPAEDVRLRLRLAELLGPEALAHVPMPTLSTKEVEWLGKLAHRAIYKPALTARRQGITVAQLKRRISQVRGLAGECGETGPLPEPP
ncbi:MAG TPA: hypothetical protein VHP56_00455 [Solirubrobacterales bacterium]|jgi:hypothetical protein|nr:hypothetical protein [Solirubrobacterales bacterium]